MGHRYLSPLAYARFVPRLPAAKRRGLSCHDCIPEPSLVPNTWQAPSNASRLMRGRGQGWDSPERNLESQALQTKEQHQLIYFSNCILGRPLPKALIPRVKETSASQSLCASEPSAGDPGGMGLRVCISIDANGYTSSLQELLKEQPWGLTIRP